MQIELTFGHTADIHDKLRLRWQVRNIPTATNWLGNLQKALESGYQLNTRHVGFPEPHSHFEAICRELNAAISIINQHGGYVIPERAQPRFDRQFANRIHHHFELLRGPVGNPSQFYINCPLPVNHAINRLNDLIHEYDSFEKQRSQTTATAFLCTQFSRDSLLFPATELTDSDYQHFSLNQKFGSMVLHYGQIGKTWFEVFNDEDEEIFADAILPLHLLRSDFDIIFTRIQYSQHWHEKFHQFLRQHGQSPTNPRLGLGYLRVADLIDAPASEAEEFALVGELQKRKLVESITLIDDDAITRYDDRHYSLNQSDIAPHHY